MLKPGKAKRTLNLLLKIALRYFFSKKTGGKFNLISIISAISLLGYVVGGAALVIVLSVFNGFEGLFTKMYSQFDSDLRVYPVAAKRIDSATFNWALLNNNELVESYSEILEENVLLRYNNQQTIATIKGVNQKFAKINHIDSALVDGVLDLNLDPNFVMVGQGIAYRLAINTNDPFRTMAIYAPVLADDGLFISPENAFNKIQVSPSAVFAVQEEVDDKFIICGIDLAKELLQNKSTFSVIDIKIKNDQNLDESKAYFEKNLGSKFIVKNRFEQRDTFFKVMKSEKTISYFILLFILFIAATNSISSLYILAMEKKRDLFVFKSMGLTPQQGGLIFLFQGLIISFVGAVFGVVLGLAVCWLQQHFGLVTLQESSNAALNTYPVKVLTKDLVLVFITVLFLGGITALYPAKRVRQIMKVF